MYKPLSHHEQHALVSASSILGLPVEKFIPKIDQCRSQTVATSGPLVMNRRFFTPDEVNCLTAAALIMQVNPRILILAAESYQRDLQTQTHTHTHQPVVFYYPPSPAQRVVVQPQPPVLPPIFAPQPHGQYQPRVFQNPSSHQHGHPQSGAGYLPSATHHHP